MVKITNKRTEEKNKCGINNIEFSLKNISNKQKNLSPDESSACIIPKCMCMQVTFSPNINWKKCPGETKSACAITLERVNADDNYQSYCSDSESEFERDNDNNHELNVEQEDVNNREDVNAHNGGSTRNRHAPIRYGGPTPYARSLS